MKSSQRISAGAGICLALLFSGTLRGDDTALGGEALVREPIQIRRAIGEVRIDGRLDEATWQEAERVETWWETRPGDNIPPKMESVAYLAFDDEFFYAAFEFKDSEPDQIRAPLGDRDDVPSYTDYGGVILDTRNDGKTAQMFLANAKGIQYDAISSDASGEDNSPDFFWDSEAQITEDGWVLEIRIPFSSLRYVGSDPEPWGILLYRNYPRDFRYQMFTSRLPRDVTCFICNVRPLIGLEGLPSGSHWVAAPYATANRLDEVGSERGSLEDGDVDGDAGLDIKWLPNPDTVIDIAINPDFSQIESDVAQIGANERFALFFPERRPFFLESVDLFSTPINAVYTRSITSPRWGARATGSFAARNHYTVLVSEDRGGGLSILPGPNGSSFALQDFESLVTIGRFRRDYGQSFASALYSGREIDGGGYNRVLGPDFRWRPNDRDTVTGQLLFSKSETPNRPDLAEEWDGRELQGHAFELWWHRDTGKWDFFSLVQDHDEEFRADNGFVPRVGHRRGIFETGRTFWPEDNEWVSRVRVSVQSDYAEDKDGNLLLREITPGVGIDGRWNSFFRVELGLDEIRADLETFERNQVRTSLFFTASDIVSRVEIVAIGGDEVDFANDRLGDGVELQLGLELRPTDHLKIKLDYDYRTLDVINEEGLSGRLFTASVARFKAVYTFNSRTWLRLIGQQVHTERDPELYTFEVDPKSSTFGGSAVFAYKLNWQTVVFVGYADNRVLDVDTDDLEPASRELFVKVSYAFQG